MRKLTTDDFLDKGCVSATYNGNSRYLTKGQTYNVCFVPARKKVSVPVAYNPTAERNWGMEFSMGVFLIDEE